MPFYIPAGTDAADGVTQIPLQPYGASGTPHVLGTPLPTGQYSIFDGSGTGNFTTIQEPPGSPKIERAEQCTCEHTLEMSYYNATFYLANMGRGTVLTDSFGNLWKVLSSDLERTNQLHAKFHYVMEALSFDSPPDDFSIHAVSLDLNIIKYPRYWWALCPYASEETPTIKIGDTAVVPITEIKECIIRMIQNYIESPFFPTVNQTNSLIQVNIINAITNGNFQINYNNPTFDPTKKPEDPVFWSGNAADIAGLGNPNCIYYILTVPATALNLGNPTDPITIALAAAKELISKLWRQEDTPYLVGYEIVWAQYFFAPVFLNPGGYQEDPRDWVPGYFMTPDFGQSTIPRGLQWGDPDMTGAQTGDGSNHGDNMDTNFGANFPPGSPTILDLLAVYNPQCYSDDRTQSGNVKISSLRTADDEDYERTWFKVQHGWKVAPVGKWDSDIYLEMGVDGPQNADDYNINPPDQSGI